MKLIRLLLLVSVAAAAAGVESTRWYTYEEGILAAGTQNKPMFLDFYADWCGPCIAMEEGTYPDPRVVRELSDFVAIKVDTQKRIDIESKYGIAYYPTVIILDPEGREISRYVGYLGPEDMVNEIKQARGKLPKETAGFEVMVTVLVFVLLLIVKKRY
ncbi:Thiol:disulfide interchange protein DsbD [uncultured archaeon]|nr:Thiol:disulfide interchange protein DsbD [uncultured archaeon]